MFIRVIYVCIYIYYSGSYMGLFLFGSLIHLVWYVVWDIVPILSFSPIKIQLFQYHFSKPPYFPQCFTCHLYNVLSFHICLDTSRLHGVLQWYLWLFMCYYHTLSFGGFMYALLLGRAGSCTPCYSVLAIPVHLFFRINFTVNFRI